MSSGEDQSVSHWIDGLKEGDGEAARLLWNRFFGRAAGAARQRLRRTPSEVTGSEDIAASVFESLWDAARNGRLDDIRGRQELWWLHWAITRQKIATHVRRQMAQKRGGSLSGFVTLLTGAATFSTC